jgi:D-beta-D-heptose 7-phosphate kinase/D-beta-D-heptose 1-phosphate adenosyltransferase
MKSTQHLPDKIYRIETLQQEIFRQRIKNKTIVFTNGVFDLLHHGHIASLTEAAAYGHFLVVAVNTDASVKRLKGPERPINDENTRALLLAHLCIVDAVILFDEDTPLQLINAIMPDVLVKGGEYTVAQIAGAKEVIAHGGKVILANIVDGISTTKIIDKLKQG